MTEKSDAPNPRALLTEGKRHLATGDHTSAIQVLEQVIELRPEIADAWYELAKAYHKLGKTEKRELCIERVLVLKPEWEKFIEKLRSSPDAREQVHIEDAPLMEESSQDQKLKSVEEIEVPYPFEMLDALLDIVISELIKIGDEGIIPDPFVLQDSRFGRKDVIRILDAAAEKERKEQAYIGYVAYLKLNSNDQDMWKTLMALAESMKLKDSFEASKLALTYLQKEEPLPPDFWKRFPVLEFSTRT